MRSISSPRVPSARIAACPSSAASFSTPGPSRSARRSWAPSAARRRDEAAPIPLAAPVTSIVRPVSFPISRSPLRWWPSPSPCPLPQWGRGIQGISLFDIPLPSRGEGRVRGGLKPRVELLEPAGDVDGDAGGGLRVLGGEEADHARLVLRHRHSAERHAGGLLGPLLRRPLVPAGLETLGQGQAGSYGVDVDAERPELERDLLREGDDAALGRRVGAAAALAEAAARDGGDVHDLATLLPLHDRGDSVAEEKRSLQVEGDEALPLREAQLVDLGGGAGNDGASPHRVDEDIDASELADHAFHHAADLVGVEGIGLAAVRAAAR